MQWLKAKWNALKARWCAGCAKATCGQAGYAYLVAIYACTIMGVLDKEAAEHAVMAVYMLLASRH